MDKFHSELGHARIVALAPFGNFLHYKQGQQISWAM
jgi:hypothetical protein